MGDYILSLVPYFLMFIIVYVGLSYAVRAFRDFGLIHSRWHHSFDGLQFSPQEFYTSVEQAVNEKQVDKIEISRKDYWQTSVFSTRREYLRVSRGEQMILICVARFGTGSFVSFWAGETLNFIKEMIPRIPFFGERLARAIYSKTYFQMDTDDMFKDCVRKCVLDVIDRITNDKGVRQLTELERRPIEVPLRNSLA